MSKKRTFRDRNSKPTVINIILKELGEVIVLCENYRDLETTKTHSHDGLLSMYPSQTIYGVLIGFNGL